VRDIKVEASSSGAELFAGKHQWTKPLVDNPSSLGVQLKDIG
jgi:hypothetical protein